MIKFYVNTPIQIPVNLMPLVSSADFVTHVTTVEYDTPNLELVWNFVNANGVQTQENVVVSETGNYEWVNLGNGMYGVAIPASGGDTINNDTVGFGWFSGVADGCLPWRGPIITFQSTRTSGTIIFSGDEPPEDADADIESEAIAGYTEVNALSLYRYARIIGINPVHFSGAGNIGIPDGRLLFPLSQPDGTFYQEESHHPRDNVSRQEINEAITDAESLVEDFLGSFVTPKWVRGEQVNPKHHFDPYIGIVERNIRNENVIYRPKWDNFISGGIRGSYLIAENVPVVYADPDEDGWNEVAIIEFDLEHAGTSLYEVQCFFPGYNGAQQYEIRPPLSKTKEDATVEMRFETWKMINPSIREEFPSNDQNALINLMEYGNIVDHVDIYRKFNSTVQDHATIFYESCGSSLDYIEQSGHARLVNPEINGIEIVPANYIEDEGWKKINTLGKIKYIKLNYYSGYTYRPTYGANYWDDLHPDLAKAIAYIATARLSRPLAGRAEVTALSQKLQMDLATTDRGGFRYTTNELVENPFGSLAGEVFAWRRLKHFQRKFRKYRN